MREVPAPQARASRPPFLRRFSVSNGGTPTLTVAIRISRFGSFCQNFCQKLRDIHDGYTRCRRLGRSVKVSDKSVERHSGWQEVV